MSMPGADRALGLCLLNGSEESHSEVLLTGIRVYMISHMRTSDFNVPSSFMARVIVFEP